MKQKRLTYTLWGTALLILFGMTACVPFESDEEEFEPDLRVEFEEDVEEEEHERFVSDEALADADLTILPLGDSRVEGFRPVHESYRFELWKNLVDNGWRVDFVGSRVDDGDYPVYQGQAFDRDHEGTGGAMTSDIIETLEDILTTENVPDVVLLGIGGNDLVDEVRNAEETVANIKRIIDMLQEANSNVTILVEQIAPARSDLMSPEFSDILIEFNAGIGELAEAEGARVIAVEMGIDWSDEYMPDQLHYNEAGAKIVADRYYETLEMMRPVE